jgi:hypothetical protein
MAISSRIRAANVDHIISLHGAVTLLDFCRRHRVHYRLLSTYVGSFACPGIDTRVQGTTVFSLIQQILFVFTTVYVPWPGLNPHTDPSRIVVKRVNHSTSRPGHRQNRSGLSLEAGDIQPLFFCHLSSPATLKNKIKKII